MTEAWTDSTVDESNTAHEDKEIPPPSSAGPELFSSINAGLHDGFFVDDLGWALLQIREAHGIEPIVSLVNGGTPDSFFTWVQNKVHVTLDDWEPVQVTLYQAWVEVDADTSSTGLSASYRVWRNSSECYDEVVIRPVDVFALRHRAWPLLKQGRIREFNVAMQLSHMKARWARANPGRALEPNDMEGDAGFVVTGRPRGQVRTINLTWPVADVAEAIRHAEALKKRRVADLGIFEASGLGVPFTKRTYRYWLRIAELDRRFGGNALLVDLVRMAGL